MDLAFLIDWVLCGIECLFILVFPEVLDFTSCIPHCFSTYGYRLFIFYFYSSHQILPSLVELNQVVNLRPRIWVPRDRITKAHQNAAT